MKGVILRKGERAYSYFSGVFSAIFPAVVERNWLITGYENYPEALEPYGGNLGREAFFWVPGERLEEIVRQQDYPWYWGVLSGFKREVPLHQVISYGLPMRTDTPVSGKIRFPFSIRWLILRSWRGTVRLHC